MSPANSMQNNTLATMIHSAPRSVVSAIKGASEKTGVNFAYLMQQAKAESSFNPDIKAKTSSASGLFQFIESTWMDMVEKYGAKYGIDTQGKSRKEVLDMRFDEEKSSAMAAEFASENERILKHKWGGDVGATELYFAHFLGAGQASEFLKARDATPLQQAAVIFPKAAKANHNVFYEAKTGRARSLDEVYAFFDKKFQIKEDKSSTPDVMIAQNIPSITPSAPLYQSQHVLNTMRAMAATSHWPRSYAPTPYQSLVNSPVDIMLLAELEMPLMGKENDQKRDSFPS